MTALVAELVELARGEEPEVAPTEFRLDEVVRGAVDRAARRAPGVSFRTRLEPSMITGVPERVERAVTNLLDNARKWSPPSETVDVAVHDGLVEVRDRGPGIAATDAPLVFNRFYRAKAARGMPGAGLGPLDRQADRRRPRRQREHRLGRRTTRCASCGSSFYRLVRAALEPF